MPRSRHTQFIRDEIIILFFAIFVTDKNTILNYDTYNDDITNMRH